MLESPYDRMVRQQKEDKFNSERARILGCMKRVYLLNVSPRRSAIVESHSWKPRSQRIALSFVKGCESIKWHDEEVVLTECEKEYGDPEPSFAKILAYATTEELRAELQKRGENVP